MFCQICFHSTMLMVRGPHVHLIYPHLFTFCGGISKVNCSYLSLVPSQNSAQNTGRICSDPEGGDESGDGKSSRNTGAVCENCEGHLSDILKKIKWQVIYFSMCVEFIPLWYIILKLKYILPSTTTTQEKCKKIFIL